MSLLKNVFGRQKSHSNEDWSVIEHPMYSLKDAEDSHYRFLFPASAGAALTVPQKLVVDMVKASLQKQEYRNKAVPRLPAVIPKLLRSLKDPDSSAKDYVSIINKDPVMSASVLKLANSVFFNPVSTRIDELEAAVVKLGIDGLRLVLSAAVMQPIIQRESAYFSHTGQKIWQHSLACAVACELIADYRKQEKFKVYVMGLVHDIGKITLFSELCKQFEMNGEKVKPGYNAFTPVMKLLSPALSFWIAKDWDLPKEICKAIAEQVSLAPGNQFTPFGHILYQANLVAEMHTTLYRQNKELAEKVLVSLDLPANLYSKLDMLGKDYS